MKLFLSMRILLIGVFFLAHVKDSWAQFQLSWVHHVILNEGNIIDGEADSQGGVFLAIQTRDTVCGYDMGQIQHINSNGQVAWKSNLYYENPCLQQSLTGFVQKDDRMWYSLYDTIGWVVNADTQSSQMWQVDTGLSLVVTCVNELSEVTAFEPQWSEVFNFDQTGGLLWSYDLPYTFTTSIRNVILDKDDNRIVIFDYINPAQSDNRGEGVLMLNSAGIFQWDTLLNPQTTPDIDFYVDAETDNQGNIFLLTKDLINEGAYITKISQSGNVVSSTQYTPSPVFRSAQLVIDTVHNVVYVGGRRQGEYNILVYDNALNVVDTMVFYRTVPDNNAIAINEYGAMYHLWVSDSNGFEMRLELYNHLGVLLDTYFYWDSTRYNLVIPQEILFDELGSIFILCNARDTNMDNAALVIKLSNPLAVESDVVEKTINVFPNPSNEVITVHLDNSFIDGELMVYSAAGIVVDKRTISHSSETINSTLWSAGVYFIVIQSNNSKLCQKIIVER